MHTITLYVDPLGTGVGKVNPPLLMIVIVSPPLFCSCKLNPSRFVTEPPTVNEFVVHVIAMFVTLAFAIVPAPFATAQV